MAILRNSIKCTHCGFEMESTHRHDFRTHSCEGMQKHYGKDAIIAVDGGLSYLRRLYTNATSYFETSQSDDDVDSTTTKGK